MDLNLIRVFVAIYETRNLTQASERLYVTQSAVSQSLAKLRSQFDDVLFQRTGGDMSPTPLANQLYHTFSQALFSIEKVLDDRSDFDPATSDRVFRVALSELGEIGWLPMIYQAIHQLAPRVKLEVIPLQREHLSEWLTKGSVDLAITPVKLDKFYERKHIKWQSYVVVMSDTNPLAKKSLRISEFDATPRISIGSDSGSELIEAAFAQAGVTSQAAVSVQHYTTLPQLLSESSELIALIPESIAQGWKHKWPLVLKPLPFEMKPVELGLYKRRSTEQQTALDWFYTTVARAIGGSSGEFAVIQ